MSDPAIAPAAPAPIISTGADPSPAPQAPATPPGAVASIAAPAESTPDAPNAPLQSSPPANTNPPANPPANPIANPPSRSTAPAKPKPAKPDLYDILTPGELIAQITGGNIKPDKLSPERRQDCIHYLVHQGYTTMEIARTLRVSERTITRARQAARAAAALAPSRAATAEYMGEFQTIALASIQRLTALCNNPRTPIPARVRAEEAINRIYQRFLDTAKNMKMIASVATATPTTAGPDTPPPASAQTNPPQPARLTATVIDPPQLQLAAEQPADR